MATTTGYIDYTEQAAPSNPSASHQRLFVRSSDHLLCVINSSGTVTPLATGSGNVATDTIWDAAGDLAQGTGADTAAKLSAGSAGQFLMAGGASTALAWKSRRLDYVTFTSVVNPTGTTEATATTIVTGSAIAYDGSTEVDVEFFCNGATPDTGSAGNTLIFALYDGSSSIGIWGYVYSQAASNAYVPVRLSRTLTPSNATHTYSVRAYVNSGSGTVIGGAGGNGANVPGFIKITRSL